MNAALIDNVAAAVLYEGYLLYPYRASAVKNRQRWNFGVLYPREYAEAQSGADAWTMRTECLLRTEGNARLHVRVRFLHLMAQAPESQGAQGAMEREIAIPPLLVSELNSCAVHRRNVFSPATRQQPVDAMVEAEAERIDGDLFKIRVVISNAGVLAPAVIEGSARDRALLQSLVSTHTVLSVEDGEFISLLDPPEELRTVAASCQNLGTWPVLAGEPGARDAMLSSPIILYDYPQIALESPGALFDGTEIDEILSLRILTLTNEEKLAMAQDERTREILERTESMPPEQFMKMHGVLRGIPGEDRP